MNNKIRRGAIAYVLAGMELVLSIGRFSQEEYTWTLLAFGIFIFLLLIGSHQIRKGVREELSIREFADSLDNRE